MCRWRDPVYFRRAQFPLPSLAAPRGGRGWNRGPDDRRPHLRDGVPHRVGAPLWHPAADLRRTPPDGAPPTERTDRVVGRVVRVDEQLLRRDETRGGHVAQRRPVLAAVRRCHRPALPLPAAGGPRTRLRARDCLRRLLITSKPGEEFVMLPIGRGVRAAACDWTTGPRPMTPAECLECTVA